MVTTIADLTLGIKKCVFLVAQILESMEPEFLPYRKKFGGYYGVDFQTRPLYNGRESGLVFSMTKGKFREKKTINVYVYEHRVCDDLCVIAWESDNCAKDGGFTDEDICFGAVGGKSFKYGEYQQCAKYVYQKLADFSVGCEMLLHQEEESK